MANRCHFQCCLQVYLQLLPSLSPGSHELNIFFSKDNAANREKRKILDQNPEVEFAQSQPPKRATQKPSDLAVLRYDPRQGSTDLLIFQYSLEDD